MAQARAGGGTEVSIQVRINRLAWWVKSQGFFPERIVMGPDIYNALVNELVDVSPAIYPSDLHYRAMTRNLKEFHGLSIIVTATQGQLEVLPGNFETAIYADKFRELEENPDP